ncbi:group II intron maturase-specific domain-containing protein [Flexivirga caeni]|uniref:group II intron maturase-specific domain-containing protein n=1 Tax=Flexivirga caeni TaxID=2294115 RepID=UPI00319DC9D8
MIDEHFDAKWAAHGGGDGRRAHRRHGGATYRLVRYADDLVVMVHGTAEQANALRDEVSQVVALIGLRLAEEKTHTVHIDDGFDFLGFRVQRHTQWGTNRRRVYTYPSNRAVKTVRRKVKELTGRQTINQDPAAVFTRLGQILRGWTNYYRHGRRRSLSVNSGTTCGTECGSGCDVSTRAGIGDGWPAPTAHPETGGRSPPQT